MSAIQIIDYFKQNNISNISQLLLKKIHKNQNTYMTFLNSSVKQVQDLRIKLNLVVLHNLLLTELGERNQSCSKIQNPIRTIMMTKTQYTLK